MDRYNIYRRIYRRYGKLLCCFVVAHVYACVYILDILENSRRSNSIQHNFPLHVYDPFESSTTRQCSMPDIDHHSVGSHLTSVDKTNDPHQQRGFCQSFNWSETADIKMEDLWDNLNVGYPKLVLTVTGWVEMVRVETWTNKPLTVIVMPHSHQDPGWLQTVEGYFNMYTRSTLDQIVDRLTANPSYKFVWTEIIFLEMWWTQTTEERKQLFKKLLANGQLELLTGGWVMTDEATTHYVAMLDQLTEGHQWIHNTFNTSVTNSWAIDPFGLSSTMPYLIQEAGIDNVVITRAHYAIKRNFAAQKHLEFYWQQHWHKSAERGVFCHVMPFHYDIPKSCGPDRSVCCKFDFHKRQCFQGTSNVQTTTVTEKNVAQLASELWEQLQKKSELFRSDVVLMPHGDDFRFASAMEWDSQFGNLGKLMEYINNNKNMQMKIKFGTLNDYFNEVHNSDKGTKYEPYPLLMGDFLSYSDRGDQYWSGYYTSRPFYKYIARQLQTLLRSAEYLYSIASASININTNMTGLYQELESARRSLALHQHHDAITGTSTKSVMKDYGTRLYKAIKQAQIVQTGSIQALLKDTSKSRNITVNLTKEYPSSTSLPEKTLLYQNLPINVLVSNHLGHSRRDIVHVRINTNNVGVVDSSGRHVQHQISPVWKKDEIVEAEFMLTFEVDMQPLNFQHYTIVNADITSAAVATIITNSNGFHQALKTTAKWDVNIHDINSSELQLSNRHLTATFSDCDGMLKFVHYHSNPRTVYMVDTHFVTYTTGVNTHPFRDKSGAYTFLPDGVAKELSSITQRITVVKGPLFTQIRTIYQDIVHVSTLYNVTGPLGRGVHIENEVNINNDEWNNKELVMRMQTNIIDIQQTFCVDVNGFQMYRRKTRAKMYIQGNFYPMTTMALLENKDARLTLVTSETHAVASLVSGWLEVVLDRRLMQHDWRGLSEHLTDNLLTKSSFFVMIEQRVHTHQVKPNKYMCLPSAQSDFLSEWINNPLTVVTTNVIPAPIVDTSWYSSSIPSLPCGLHILNLRMLPFNKHSTTKEALLVIHRRGISCEFQQDYCQFKETFSIAEILPTKLHTIQEMDIVGVSVRSTIARTNKIQILPMNIKTFKISFR